jgi:hypothetical protein
VSSRATPLTVRLRELGGVERLHRPNRYILECGYDRERASKAKGGMVAVYFDRDEQLADALEILASQWASARRVCEGEAERPRLLMVKPERNF